MSRLKPPRNKNLGKHPADPDYDDSYDEESELDLYEEECEAREEQRRLNEYIEKYYGN